MPSGFGGRPGSEVGMRHVFPQGVLAAVTLVRGGDGGAKARATLEPGLLLCLVTYNALLGARFGCQVVGEEALRVRSKLVPLQVCVLTCPSIGTFALEGSSMGANKVGAGTYCGPGHMLVPAPIRTLNSSCSSTSASTSNGCPLPIWVLCWVRAGSVLDGCILSSAVYDFALVESCTRTRGVGVGVQCGWGQCWTSWGKLARVPSSFNQLPLHCFANHQACACSLWVDSRSLLALLQDPLVFSQPSGLIFPVWGPRAGMPNREVQLLTPQGGSPSCGVPLLFCIPSQEHRSWADPSFSPLTWLCESFFPGSLV